MAQQIQTTYPLQQARGQVGAISRPLAPVDCDVVEIEETNGKGLRPGDAFKLDGGKAVNLTDLADSANGYGVLTFEYSEVNQPLDYGKENSTGIEYEGGEVAKFVRSGYIYGIAGAALEMGQSIGLDPTDHKWKPQTGTPYVAAGAVATDEVCEIIVKNNA